MLKFNRQFVVITLPVAAAFAFATAPDAVAQKRVSYEQAFASCKTQLDGMKLVGDVANAKMNMGSSCMMRHGHRLKKKN